MEARSRRSGGQNPYAGLAMSAGYNSSAVQPVVRGLGRIPGAVKKGQKKQQQQQQQQHRGAQKGEEEDPDSMFVLDPEIQAAFDRNIQFFKRVFSIETLVSPLPPQVGQQVARSVHSFIRIFTQFFDPDGIANAQQSLGLRNDRKGRGRAR